MPKTFSLDKKQLRQQALWVLLIAALLASLAGVLAHRDSHAAQGPDILVFADSDFMNTAEWIKYLRQQDFKVRVVYEPSISLMHGYLRVPRELQSLHVALVDGYVIVGHVPAEDILRLLREKPSARGLAVPGVPGRAPGMSHLSADRRPYEVLLFDERGGTQVFARH